MILNSLLLSFLKPPLIFVFGQAYLRPAFTKTGATQMLCGIDLSLKFLVFNFYYNLPFALFERE